MKKEGLHKLSILFAAIGLLVSIYLTAIHYASIAPACPETNLFNCENVLTSQYSTILGIPIAVLGLVFFLAELSVILLIKNEDAFIVLSGIGLAFVAYFVYTEYLVGSICIYCTTVHISTIALFILAALQSKK
ncbi:MAG: vitamin K epoxide reductase family protein [Candidatus Micrarchaeota archaeon]|nr:vitamin K epoxide reductase family protein [Candidatus Micrarchaeota archaeon]MDE1834479.1 vitamin K epoxide reductase family protein [Candidatus Micrarchaeota archaeon]MDE1859274.1 vitamin K epoxide reductase family protein [Candidatus Micrarchaeota archaeon]